MIPITKLSHTEIQKVRTACAYLFSPELARQDKYINGLTIFSVDKAFQKKARRYHPDLHRHEPKEILQKRGERFERIIESYKILKPYFDDQNRPASDEHTGPCQIIAIGGAKGGIGKSMFAANLGIVLTRRSKRVVLADLDLGGANLHLCLGLKSVKATIDHFLTKAVPTLEDIIQPTEYGPYLIGGNSSQLGAANIHFARKLKLIKAIKRLEADYVILDLGGDTSYNVIDCFLSADRHVVFTTCDPASYLEAYSFIKVALLRKLERIFGPESPLCSQKDSDLESIIRDFVRSPNTRPIEVLMQQIKTFQPQNFAFVKGVINSFSPQIIINLTDEDSIAENVVVRIQDVSKKMSGLQVGYLGNIPYQPEIQNSARDLVPVVARYPQGSFAESIGKMVVRLSSESI